MTKFFFFFSVGIINSTVASLKVVLPKLRRWRIQSERLKEWFSLWRESIVFRCLSSIIPPWQSKWNSSCTFLQLTNNYSFQYKTKYWSIKLIKRSFFIHIRTYLVSKLFICFCQHLLLKYLCIRVLWYRSCISFW